MKTRRGISDFELKERIREWAKQQPHDFEVSDYAKSVKLPVTGQMERCFEALVHEEFLFPALGTWLPGEGERTWYIVRRDYRDFDIENFPLI